MRRGKAVVVSDPHAAGLSELAKIATRSARAAGARGTRPSKPRKDEEHEIQSAFFAWSQEEATLREMPELHLLHAVPNGASASSMAAAKRRKREGQKPGVPDVDLPAVGWWQHLRGLRIEFKAGKGTPSPEQRWWLARLADHGHSCWIAWSVEAAQAVVRWYLRGGPKPPEGAWLHEVKLSAPAVPPHPPWARG